MTHPDTDPVDDDTDLVRVLLQRMSALVPQLSDVDLQTLEQEIRARFGGRRVFVAKRRRQGFAINRRLSEAEREALVNEAITTKSTNEELQSKYGVSRATLYRHFKR